MLHDSVLTDKSEEHVYEKWQIHVTSTTFLHTKFNVASQI